MEMPLRAICNCYFNSFIHMYKGEGCSITIDKTDRDARGHIYKLLQNHGCVDMRKWYFAEHKL